MSAKNNNSINHKVFKKAYKRLHLSPTNRIIFQRLLGFLLRNDDPFPYSAPKMAEITGFSKRTVFNSLNDLEKCRLIVRFGEGKNRRFKRGSILIKIIATVQNSTNKEQYKNSATVQLLHQKLNNRATRAYKKTCSSLKRVVCGGSGAQNPPVQKQNTHTKDVLSSFSPAEDCELRSRCLSDESVQNLFQTKFADYAVTLEQLFDECVTYYANKHARVTLKLFLRWVRLEKIENHTKTISEEKKHDGKAKKAYQEYVSLAKSDPRRKTPILTYPEFMLSSEDKHE